LPRIRTQLTIIEIPRDCGVLDVRYTNNDY
jgi:hypothetical protein